MKKYAVTYTIDNDWQSVDTMLVETDTNPRDMTSEELFKMFDGYVYNSKQAEMLANEPELWFSRNIEDTDVRLEA